MTKINPDKFNQYLSKSGTDKLPMVLINKMIGCNRRVYVMVKELAYECDVTDGAINYAIRKLKESKFIVTWNYDWGKHYYELNKDIFEE